MLERAVLLGSGTLLEPSDLQLQEPVGGAISGSDELREIMRNPFPADGVDLERIVNGIEESLVRKAIEAADGNQTEAGRLLGLNRDKLRYRLKQYGLKD